MQNKIYSTELLDADGDSRTVLFKGFLDPEHPVFKGHFPQKPILPGVCMIDIVRDIARRVIDETLVLSEGTNIKFTSVVDPVADPAIKVDFSYTPGDDGSVSVKSTVYNAGKPCMKFAGRFVRS